MMTVAKNVSDIKDTAADLIRTELAFASNWLTVADLSARTGIKEPSIRRILNNEKRVYRCRPVPGDTKGRKQWAFRMNSI